VQARRAGIKKVTAEACLLGDARAREQVAIRGELNTAHDVGVLPLVLAVQRAFKARHLQEAPRHRVGLLLPLRAPLPAGPPACSQHNHGMTNRSLNAVTPAMTEGITSHACQACLSGDKTTIG
jgi:hypothetical protein